MNLQQIAEKLLSWLNGGGSYNFENCIYIDKEKNFVKMVLFTDINQYNITANENYLGCVAQSRKPRAGEDWNRGNDLPDGEFSKDVWNDIILTIVKYELVDIKRPIKELYKK